MELLGILLVVAIIFIVEQVIYHKYGLANLTYDCTVDKLSAYEGENIELIEILNNKKIIPVPWIKTEITTSKWLDFAGSQSVTTNNDRFVPSFFVLKSFQRVTRKWKVKCLKRGVFNIKVVSFVASDPFGRLNLSKPIRENTEICIKPTPADLEGGIITANHLNGDFFVKRKLLTDPFFTVGVREYSESDPMNKIHWKSTAKEQRLMVKTNDYTSTQNLAIIMNSHSRTDRHLDVNDEYYAEWCIKICCSYLVQAREMAMPVSFCTNSSLKVDEKFPIDIPQSSGNDFIEGIFETFARMSLHITEDFDDYLTNLFDRVTATDIVIVTSTLTENIVAFATRKSYLGSTVKIIFVGKQLPEIECHSCDIFVFNPHEQEQQLGGEK